ncbi:MAG: HD domain-containing phosphohydrolase [Terriglobia bacterium]
MGHVLQETNVSRVLVVDDNKATRELLIDCLKEAGYEVISAVDGHQALEIVESARPDLVLLDVMMPGVDGYHVCAQIKGSDETRFIPVVMVSVLSDVKDRVKGIEVGADDFLNKPVSRVELLTRVKSLLRAKYLNEALETVRNVIFSLSAAIEASDPYLKGHSERVADYSACFAQFLGLSEKDQELLTNAGMLHDVGKIGISKEVLHKPGPLTDAEFAQIRTHPISSEKICQPLRSSSPLLPVIRHHQERYDGKGYPDGLKGDEIPLGARMLAIADAYDALTSQRSYRGAMTRDEALDVLRKGAGQQWDPELIGKFVQLMTNLPEPAKSELN